MNRPPLRHRILKWLNHQSKLVLILPTSEGSQIIAPWKMPEFYNRFKGRQGLFEYAKVGDIPLPILPKSPWSMDSNLMHIRYDSVITLNMYLRTKDPTESPNQPDELEIEFENGEFQSKHGVGRDDLIENRFTGMKARGIYETPGGTILLAAHLDLESMTMDREMWRIKESLGRRFSEQVYNGMSFRPISIWGLFCEGDLISFDISGTVCVSLFKGHVSIMRRKSLRSLYKGELVCMRPLPESLRTKLALHRLRLQSKCTFVFSKQYLHLMIEDTLFSLHMYIRGL
uniref:argininosuccinate synthase n=1 Tax=Eptatretus burgeri TaxID=7764 RepID=A0A8C4N8W1_EPTBU